MSDAIPAKPIAATRPRANTSHLALELYLRRELRRHYLSERERLVADALLEISHGWGLEAVCIPKLDLISRLTGLARPHVHGAIKGLFDMKILRVASKAGGLMRYTFNPNTESWKVKIRCARASVNSAKEFIQEVNHLAAQDNLTDLARLVAAKKPMRKAKARSARSQVPGIKKDKPSFFDDNPAALIAANGGTDSVTQYMKTTLPDLE